MNNNDIDFSQTTTESFSSQSSYSDEETPIRAVPTFPVKLRDCGSTYARRLYDVDGFTLTDEEGELLNVYTKKMQDALESGRLRAIRSLRNNYLYFIRKETQRQRFLHEREKGSTQRKITYYVYFDKEYKD